MKKRLLLALIIITVVFSIILSGCQTGTISQAQYDQVNARLIEAQARLSQAQADLLKAQADNATAAAQLKSAQEQITLLQGQVNSLKEQATLTGATPADTAAIIVKNYHETHVYSSYDLFVCSDMASEVWNMLKAKGISAVVVVGDKDNLISDILQSNHAWVLADIAPGQYLALETTGGYVVPKTENPLYYVGWSFSSPADLKSYNDWVKEYNIRVGFRNQLNNEANKAFTLGDSSLYTKLVELRIAQETELNNLMTKIKALATPISY